MRRSPHPLLVLLCVALPCLAPASPRLRMVAPPSVTSGTAADVSVRIRPEESEILSWSFGVGLDGLSVQELTVAGTDFERLASGGYAQTHVSPDGAAFASIAVLSFVDPVTLPPAEPEVLRVTCLVTRLEPGEARLIPQDGIDFPGSAQPINNEVLLLDGGLLPLETEEAVLAVTGCARILMVPEGRAPGDAFTPVEVRKDSQVVLNGYVQVASSEHLNPTGFSFALLHNPALLELQDATFPEAFLDGYVEDDGFARVEIWERGFSAAVLSSAATPHTLGPGDHQVLRVAYRYPGGGRPGDVFRTHLGFAQEIPPDGVEARHVFQPGDAPPCSLEDLPLELEVGPHYWIRGDANVDGLVDISDGITMLQYLFLGGPGPCLLAMEANSDGEVDLTDAIYILNYLFLSGDEPAPPFPDCGAAEETLPCEVPTCPA